MRLFHTQLTRKVTAIFCLCIGLTLLMSATVLRADVEQGRIITYPSPYYLSPNITDTDFIAIASRANVGAAIRADHSLYCWRMTQSPPTGNDFVSISAAYQNMVALRSDGTIEAWGNDAYGLVSNKPQGNGYKSIACNFSTCVAVKGDGTLIAWGNNSVWGNEAEGLITRLPGDSGYVSAALGAVSGVALKSDGSLVSWGDNSYQQVTGTPGGTGFKAVYAGGFHCVAVAQDGSLVSWGDDRRGQVSGTPPDKDFKAISCGDYHTLAIRSDGSLTSWGADWGGPPNTMPSGNDFIAISADVVGGAAIRANNQKPHAYLGDDFTLEVHDLDPIYDRFRLVGMGWDEDNDPLTYTLTDEYDNVLASGKTGAYSLALAERDAGFSTNFIYASTGTHTYTLTVTDQFGASGSDQVTVTVLPDPNEAPRVYIEVDSTQPLPILHDGNPQTGVAILLYNSDYDPDYDMLTYEWRDETGVVISQEEYLYFSNLTGGLRTFTLTVTDPYGASATGFISFVVEENAPPVLSVPPSVQVNVGCPVTVNASATDPDAIDTLTYSLVSSPAWAAINSTTGQITLSPPPGTVGNFTLQVKVTDPYGASDTKSIAVTVCPIIIESVSASRKNGVVTVQFNLRNTDGTIVSNVSLNSATLKGVNTFTSLPIVYPQLKSGVVKTVQLKFSGVSSGPATFLVNGTSSVGPVNANMTINVP